MIKTVQFNDFRSVSDCIILRRSDWAGSVLINVAFPFHEDTPNFTITVPEALTLRNAIDDLVAVKMLGEPEPKVSYTAEEIISGYAPSNINIPDSARIRGLLEDYQLQNDYDAGARQALGRVIHILKLKEDH